MLPRDGSEDRRRLRGEGRRVDRAEATPGARRRWRRSSRAHHPGVRGDLGSGPGWHSAALGDAGRRARRRVRDARAGAASSRPTRGGCRATSSACRSGRARSAARGRTSRTCTCRPSGCRWRSPSSTARSRSAARCTSRSPATSSRPRGATRSPAGTSRTSRRRSSARSSRAPGFEVLSSSDDGEEWIDVEATRAHMLPDTVGPDMRVLIVGLNPSVLSADKGFGFARPGQPVLAGGGRVRARHRAARSVPRAARRRRGHDQPRAPAVPRAPTS